MPEQIVSASGAQYPLVVNSDGSINISGTIATVENALSTLQTNGAWIGTGTTVIDSAPPSVRKSIAVQNISSGTFYLGGSPLNAGSAWIIRQWDTIAVDLQSGTSVYGQASAGSLDIRMMEVA